ncbi:hypothetical protein HNP84_003327 [Thermocatellispora tengchongensis]|uniref:Integral membrane protein n=1 Tax=Thermocatellispora tengchongensis TaxID=1073253 RepID=A0A840P6W3_9ACTN|nr:hypothetical protein [Thermocatellispora tengchongensis]MBB5133601.1 hypothetical protein [Thermocatellispora tengchongensis]
MESLRLVLIVCHIAALVVLLGGVVYHLARRSPAGPAVVGGAAALLGTGVLLVAVLVAGDLGINGPKIGVKTAVAAAVLGCAVAARRAVPPRQPMMYATGAFALVNAAVAALWA